MSELELASDWVERYGGDSGAAHDERLRQFSADKAKWLAKAGRFDQAWRQLDEFGDSSEAHKADRLLITTLERIAANDLKSARRAASRLADQLSDIPDSIAPVTAAIMVHNIDLMRGSKDSLPDNIAQFLRESPVAGSEHVHLPRYRQRLRDLGYAEAAA